MKAIIQAVLWKYSNDANMSHCKDYANESSITIIKHAAATQVSTPGHSGLNPAPASHPANARGGGRWL